MKKRLFFLFSQMWLPLFVYSQVFVSPADPAFRYGGSLFNKVSDTLAVFRRHSDAFLALPRTVSHANPNKARTTTGVTVTFRTDATGVKARFRMMPGQNRWSFSFALYVDGDSATVFKQKRDDLTNAGDSLFSFDLPVPTGGGEHTYTLVLPVLSTPAFAGLLLTGGSGALSAVPEEEKPVYVAYGNSITHGQGQFTGDQTWPWILAKEMGWKLYNLAVGGSTTSVPMAHMIAREITQPVDYLTILIGFNDAVWLEIDTATYRQRLTAFIDTVRQGHPETEIFVIGQTYTERTEDKDGNPLDFDDWRKVQHEVVEAFRAGGDGKIHYIDGSLFTDHDDLKAPPTDVVHLSVAGARHLGTALADTLTNLLESSSVRQTRDPAGQLILFPNPTTGRITLTGFDTAIPEISLFTLTGQKVFDMGEAGERWSGYSLTLDLSHLPGGIYLLQSGDEVKRVVIQ